MSEPTLYPKAMYARCPLLAAHQQIPTQCKANLYTYTALIHIDISSTSHYLSFHFSSLPAFLTLPIKLSSSPTSHAPLSVPPLQPSTPSTSSLLPYNLPSRAPSTATTVLMMTPSPSNTITSHTRVAISTPSPFPGPKKRVRIMGSKTSCAVSPRPVGAALNRWVCRRGNLWESKASASE